MLTTYLSAIITRELRTLIREIQSFPDDESLWRTPPGVTNSTGTLALHLAGNLRHYVGAKLGGTRYLRDRPAEFSTRDVSRKDLVREIEEAIAVVEQVFSRLTAEVLATDFPEAVAGQIVRTEEFLLHIAAHLAYHLGQVDYHRRWVTGEASRLGAVAIPELSSARPGV